MPASALGELAVPFYLVTTWLLRIWLAGLLLLVLVAFGDLLFSPQHNIRLFGRRAGLSLVWPLALLIRAGRLRLYNAFRFIQGG